MSGLYRERAHLIAVLARLYPAAIAFNDPAEPEWPVIYIHTPKGQLSWHLNPDDLDLFDPALRVHPEDPAAQWDGHNTEEKYERLRVLAMNHVPRLPA